MFLSAPHSSTPSDVAVHVEPELAPRRAAPATRAAERRVLGGDDRRRRQAAGDLEGEVRARTARRSGRGSIAAAPRRSPRLIRSSVPRSRPLTTDRTSAVARDGSRRRARPSARRWRRRAPRRRRGRPRARSARLGRDLEPRRAARSPAAAVVRRDRRDAGARPSRREWATRTVTGSRCATRIGRASCPTRRCRRPRRAGGGHRPAARPSAAARPLACAIARRRPGRAGLGAAAAGPPRARQLDRAPLAEDEPDRRAVEAERLAQPVLEVAPVAEVDRARLAGEEHERRRRDRRLGGVEDLRPPALDQRRLLAARRLAEQPVELAGRDPPAALAPDVDRELEHPPDPLAGLRADRSRSARSRGTAPRGGSSGRTGRRSGPVFSSTSVPLVDRDDEALALVDHVAGDVGVLGGQPVDGVDERGPRRRRARSPGATRSVE